ncbi:carbohydrate ABC transporter membrane protein 2, CUT1 family [Nakamurella panacisegetis]|uniref:Carbohydrate ABC transporter membrane protein 2, CUT1 family n=1 Tax=Nakamurella panacisegetis TaxID=1090615 RepID=A0A1H0IYG0_9ACTN|nr:carbohydrate ABC transporter permease [Nakamurella panacisegetis]SDO36250.1 carbohydrate ABC transporter membrane protein 2, CUT1 family [Nakamurella panacisegetis]
MTSKVFRYVILGGMGLVWLLPIYLLLANAGKSAADYSGDSLWSPGTISALWNNVVAVFRTTDVPSGLGVTLLYATVAPLIAVVLGSGVAFAVIVLKVRHGFFWFFVIFCGTVFPLQMMLIPWFSAYAKVGLFDTVPGMILIYSVVALPFSAFVMRNFFVGIAPSVFEAAVVDGAGVWRIFTRIFLPMSTSALVVVFILQATWVWNDFLISLILTQSPSTRPVMPLLNALQSVEGGGPGYTVILTAALVVSIPTAVLFGFTQRFFQKGLSLGQY